MKREEDPAAITDAVPTGDSELASRMADTDSSALVTVTRLLTDATDLITNVDRILDHLVKDIEDVDVEGILTNVEALVSELLATVQEISDDAGLGLDLSALQPTIDLLSTEIDYAVKQIQVVLEISVVEGLVDAISDALGDTLKLVHKLVSVHKLVGN